MSEPHKYFLRVLVFCFAATLLPIFILNLVLLNDTLGNNKKTLLASEWQQRTQGVTYAPTLSDTHLFKTLRLNDRLPDIDTVVFGSSTALGITQQSFPETLHIYNYAQTGHSLTSALDEAEYIQRHATNVKYLAIPLDWSVGFIYQHAEPSVADLAAATAMRQVHAAAKPIPLLDRMRDALSYPRVASLIEILKSILHSDNSLVAFRGYFLQASSDDYRCADGTPGKDFDTIHRATCTGFRFDGSATFANSDRVDNARSLILAATTSSSKYHRNLAQTEGEPDALLLQRLATLGEHARLNGGGMVLFMPPLLPGLEAEFLHHPQLASRLQRTKQRLDEWAKAQHLVIIDAGRSERFGCSADEFLDEHHAVMTCYDKIFHSFWRNATHADGTIDLHEGGLR